MNNSIKKVLKNVGFTIFGFLIFVFAILIVILGIVLVFEFHEPIEKLYQIFIVIVVIIVIVGMCRFFGELILFMLGIIEMGES